MQLIYGLFDPLPLMVRPAITHPLATAHQPGDQNYIILKKQSLA